MTCEKICDINGRRIKPGYTVRAAKGNCRMRVYLHEGELRAAPVSVDCNIRSEPLRDWVARTPSSTCVIVDPPPATFDWVIFWLCVALAAAVGVFTWLLCRA